MSLESWGWFVQLVESGTFTRAADELQIPQQTLTRAGEAFFSYAREQEAARTRMLRQVSEVTIGGSGELKVGISNMRGRVLMPHVIRQFHSSLPNVRIKLMEGTNEELIELAEHGEADVVVACFGSGHPGVSVKPLYREEVVLAIDPDLLESATGLNAEQAASTLETEGLAILADCPFLLERIDDISGRVARNELQSAGIKPIGFVESENMMTLLSLCAAGLGGLFCPTNMLDETTDLTKNLVRVKLSEEAGYQISIGTPKGSVPWLPAQMFEDILGSLYGESGGAAA